MIIVLAGATHTTECTEEGTTVAGAGAGGLVGWLFIIPGGAGAGAFLYFWQRGEGLCLWRSEVSLCLCFWRQGVWREEARGKFFLPIGMLKPNSSIILEINFVLMFMFFNRVCLFQG